MMEKKQLIENITKIESELNSFELEKIEAINSINSDKKKIIEEVKSGSFDEMLSEIENREKNKTKETLIDKLFKIF